MQKLFKTFWEDNKIFIGITLLVIFVLSIMIPTAALVITGLNIEESTYWTKHNQITTVYYILSFLAIYLANGFVNPAVAIFTSIRTTKGKARLRYNAITTTRATYSFFNIFIYIILTALISISVLLGLLIVGLFFQINFIEDFGSVFDTFFKADLILSTIMFTITSFLSYLVTFYYWHVMLMLPHTKSLRKIPFIGMIFTIIGIYLSFQIISTVVWFSLLFSGAASSLFLLDNSNFTPINLILQVIYLGLFSSIYHFFFIKQYEY